MMMRVGWTALILALAIIWSYNFMMLAFWFDLIFAPVHSVVCVGFAFVLWFMAFILTWKIWRARGE